MSDLALAWSRDLGVADLTMDGADLAREAGLRSAVVISLFTDRRADPGDTLPVDGGDRRGWWGDVAPVVEGDQIGSRLWLLAREKRVPDLLTRVRAYCVEALSWLVEDGVAASVDVTTAFVGPAGVAIGIDITRPAGPTRQRFDFVWEAL